jgi:shikimate kinase
MSLAGTRLPIKLVCLAGFMGCGKTTVGKLLAQQLGWRFVDLDERIEQQAGLRIAEIFERLGEPAFRKLENAELARAMGEAASATVPAVLALGGGTFAQPENLEMLSVACGRQSDVRAGYVIWLDCPVEQLLSRCVMMDDRPMFRDESSFRKLYDERIPFYRQADLRVEGGDVPRQVVERILASPLFGTAGASGTVDTSGTLRNSSDFAGAIRPQNK